MSFFDTMSKGRLGKSQPKKSALLKTALLKKKQESKPSLKTAKPPQKPKPVVLSAPAPVEEAPKPKKVRYAPIVL